MLLTTANLENYAKNVLGIPYVNFENIDPKTVKMVLKVLKEAFNRYPLLANSLVTIGNKEYLNNYFNLTYFADYNIWKNNNEIDINFPKFASFVTLHLYYYQHNNQFLGIGILPLLEKHNFNEFKQLVLNDKATIKHREIIEANFWHEIGHMLDFIMGISNSYGFQKIINNHDIEKEISLYATTSIKETLAEAFAEYIVEVKLNELKDGLIKDIGNYINNTYYIYANNYFLRKQFMIKDKYIIERKRLKWQLLIMNYMPRMF